VTAVRRRLSITLFAGAGLGTTGYIAAVTVSTLAVQDITGSALQSGLPSALATAGSAIGTNAMSWLVPRLGRRNGLMLGYLLSAASLGLGFLMVIFGGRGLHDRIASTRVVKGRHR